MLGNSSNRSSMDAFSRLVDAVGPQDSPCTNSEQLRYRSLLLGTDLPSTPTTLRDRPRREDIDDVLKLHRENIKASGLNTETTSENEKLISKLIQESLLSGGTGRDDLLGIPTPLSRSAATDCYGLSPLSSAPPYRPCIGGAGADYTHLLKQAGQTLLSSAIDEEDAGPDLDPEELEDNLARQRAANKRDYSAKTVAKKTEAKTKTKPVQSKPKTKKQLLAEERRRQREVESEVAKSREAAANKSVPSSSSSCSSYDSLDVQRPPESPDQTDTPPDGNGACAAATPAAEVHVTELTAVVEVLTRSPVTPTSDACVRDRSPEATGDTHCIGADADVRASFPASCASPASPGKADIIKDRSPSADSAAAAEAYEPSRRDKRRLKKQKRRDQKQQKDQPLSSSASTLENSEARGDAAIAERSNSSSAAVQPSSLSITSSNQSVLGSSAATPSDAVRVSATGFPVLAASSDNDAATPCQVSEIGTFSSMTSTGQDFRSTTVTSVSNGAHTAFSGILPPFFESECRPEDSLSLVTDAGSGNYPGRQLEEAVCKTTALAGAQTMRTVQRQSDESSTDSSDLLPSVSLPVDYNEESTSSESCQSAAPLERNGVSAAPFSEQLLSRQAADTNGGRANASRKRGGNATKSLRGNHTSAHQVPSNQQQFQRDLPPRFQHRQHKDQTQVFMTSLDFASRRSTSPYNSSEESLSRSELQSDVTALQGSTASPGTGNARANKPSQPIAIKRPQRKRKKAKKAKAAAEVNVRDGNDTDVTSGEPHPCLSASQPVLRSTDSGFQSDEFHLAPKQAADRTSTQDAPADSQHQQRRSRLKSAVASARVAGPSTVGESSGCTVSGGESHLATVSSFEEVCNDLTATTLRDFPAHTVDFQHYASRLMDASTTEHPHAGFASGAKGGHERHHPSSLPASRSAATSSSSSGCSAASVPPHHPKPPVRIIQRPAPLPGHSSVSAIGTAASSTSLLQQQAQRAEPSPGHAQTVGMPTPVATIGDGSRSSAPPATDHLQRQQQHTPAAVTANNRLLFRQVLHYNAVQSSLLQTYQGCLRRMALLRQVQSGAVVAVSDDATTSQSMSADAVRSAIPQEERKAADTLRQAHGIAKCLAEVSAALGLSPAEAIRLAKQSMLVAPQHGRQAGAVGQPASRHPSTAASSLPLPATLSAHSAMPSASTAPRRRPPPPPGFGRQLLPGSGAMPAPNTSPAPSHSSQHPSACSSAGSGRSNGSLFLPGSIWRDDGKSNALPLSAASSPNTTQQTSLSENSARKLPHPSAEVEHKWLSMKSIWQEDPSSRSPSAKSSSPGPALPPSTLSANAAVFVSSQQQQHQLSTVQPPAGSSVDPAWCQAPSLTPSPSRWIQVDNVPTISEGKLRVLFQRHGTITYLRVDPERHSAIMQYEHSGSATTASSNLNNYVSPDVVNCLPLSVHVASEESIRHWQDPYEQQLPPVVAYPVPRPYSHHHHHRQRRNAPVVRVPPYQQVDYPGSQPLCSALPYDACLSSQESYCASGAPDAGGPCTVEYSMPVQVPPPDSAAVNAVTGACDESYLCCTPPFSDVSTNASVDDDEEEDDDEDSDDVEENVVLPGEGVLYTYGSAGCTTDALSPLINEVTEKQQLGRPWSRFHNLYAGHAQASNSVGGSATVETVPCS